MVPPLHRKLPSTSSSNTCATAVSNEMLVKRFAIKKPNAIERTYFPYNTPFCLAFRIRFPRVTGDGRPTVSPSAKWFGLRFAGANGNTELIWKLTDDSRNDDYPSVAAMNDTTAWVVKQALVWKTRALAGQEG